VGLYPTLVRRYKSTPASSFMNKLYFTQEQLIQVAKLSDADIRIVNECRGEHNKLGFAYQLCYVKLFNRLPMQRPLELLDELADKFPYSIFTDESWWYPSSWFCRIFPSFEKKRKHLSACIASLLLS